MSWLAVGLWTAALVLAAANALTTRRLWSSDRFERPQKVAQTVLVWMIPGTFAVVRHFLTEPHGAPIRDLTVEVGPLDATEFEPPERHHGGGHHDGS